MAAAAEGVAVQVAFAIQRFAETVNHAANQLSPIRMSWAFSSGKTRALPSGRPAV